MRERGIIFNAEMVRAILDGRKTQTRRIMKSPCMDVAEMDDGSLWPWRENGETCEDYWYPCPFGQPGDRLWVREAFQGPLIPEDELSEYLGKNPDKFESPEYCEYAADGGNRPEYLDADGDIHYGWRPSIHMPRWASRITLEITDVRVERLNDITEQDAISEGIDADRLAESQDNYDCIADHNMTGRPTAKEYFSGLWQSIYGAESWEANPWVWVVEFRRVEQQP